VFAADAVNSGRLDLLAIGRRPRVPCHSDMIDGKFLPQPGRPAFRDETDARRAGALN